MEKEELIDLIICALESEKSVDDYIKIQNGKALQIKTDDGTYFNVCVVEVENYIVSKLK